MKTGDVLFWKGSDKFWERSISVATHSEFVHCGIAISPEYYIEAVRPQIRLVHASEIPEGVLVASPPYKNEEAAYRAAETALGFLNRPYDRLGVVNVALCLTLATWNRLPTWRLLECRRSLRAWCSRLVRVCLEAADIKIDAPFACAPGHIATALGVNAKTAGRDQLSLPAVVYVAFTRRGT